MPVRLIRVSIILVAKGSGLHHSFNTRTQIGGMNAAQYIIGLLFLTALTVRGAGDWPMFRGGPALRGVATRSLAGSFEAAVELQNRWPGQILRRHRRQPGFHRFQ